MRQRLGGHCRSDGLDWLRESRELTSREELVVSVPGRGNSQWETLVGMGLTRLRKRKMGHVTGAG